MSPSGIRVACQRLVASVFVVSAVVACGGSGLESGQSGISMGVEVLLKSSLPGSSDLIEDSRQWTDWAGRRSAVQWDGERQTLVVGSDGGAPVGVQRISTPLQAGTSYEFSLASDVSDDDTAARLILFDAGGNVLTTVGPANAGGKISFTAPAGVVGFFAELAGSQPADAVAKVAMSGAGLLKTTAGGTDLIDPALDWSGWTGGAVDVNYNPATGLVDIGAPAGGVGNTHGVQRIDMPLIEGAVYELSLPSASDAASAVLLFVIDESGWVVPFEDVQTGQTSPWLAATRDTPRQFTAPAGVASIGVQVQGPWNAVDSASLLPSLLAAGDGQVPPGIPGGDQFSRIASFAVCTQLAADCDDDTETAAEIVAASADGNTLVYSDSPLEAIGFVDVSNPAQPLGLGTLEVGGEPTSVAVTGDYAVVGVNTSEDFVNTSGQLKVYSMTDRTELAAIELPGQPDSVAVSPDGDWIAVVIENERDEDLGSGEPPQAPGGFLVVVDASGNPADWTATTVDLAGFADLYPADPEPEYVDINEDNLAVVTLQENNHIVLVDLPTATVTNDFSAGVVSLSAIDTEEEDPALISLTDSVSSIPREPDGVAWIDTEYFATANEGDLNGGSRGFTVFNKQGDVVFESGNTLEHLAVRFGHYPDGRSGNKGNEPENIEVGEFDGKRVLFVNSERSSLVFVYDATDPSNPQYIQTLPAAAGPEGGLAIGSRNLLVVASEVDDRGDKLRSVLNIYARGSESTYPTIASADRPDGTPIPWGAMSGLAADSVDPNTLWAVSDSFYQQNRIYRIDISVKPARITEEVILRDSNGVLAGLPVLECGAADTPPDDATRVRVFDDLDLAALINDDNTVNLDPEGIAVASDGGFWVASEGAGTDLDPDRPINSRNMILKVSRAGVIEDVVLLPEEINANQLRFGFEGIAEYNGKAYVAFQRAWAGDDNPRIGIFDVATGAWSFLFYPLDAVQSANGGWVGLSDLTSLGGGQFLVLERDNQGGPDAAVKRLYRIDVTGLSNGNTVSKTLVRDLMPDLAVPGGLTPEKIEGSAVTADGNVYIINDNDGVDDNSGETQLINLGAVAQ